MRIVMNGEFLSPAVVTVEVASDSGEENIYGHNG